MKTSTNDEKTQGTHGRGEGFGFARMPLMGTI